MGTDEITPQAIAEAFDRGRGTTSVYCPENQVGDLQRALRELGIEAKRSTYQTSIAPGVLLVLRGIHSENERQEIVVGQEQRAMALQEQTV